jgi:hypothetical protein
MALGRVDGLAKMRPHAEVSRAAWFMAVLSQRSAMGLKRFSLPMVCSMRARLLRSCFGKKAGLRVALERRGMMGQMRRARAASLLRSAS